MRKIIAGSTIGASHIKTKDLLIGIPNQDSYYITEKDDNIQVGVICDGCSEGENNEFGAKLASTIISKKLAKVVYMYRKTISISDSLHLAQLKLMSTINKLSKYIDLYNGFMFTIIGFVVFDNKLSFFSCGDGVYGYKKKQSDPCIKTIGPFPGNAPPYIAKKLIYTSDESYNMKIIEEIDITDLEYGFIGSDGMSEFMKISGMHFPFKNVPIVTIDELCKSEKYNNSRLLSAYLKKINLDRSGIVDGTLVHKCGLIQDDATIVVVREEIGI